MECCVGVSTETDLQIDKFYTVVKGILELVFQTVVFVVVNDSLQQRIIVQNVSSKVLFTTVYNFNINIYFNCYWIFWKRTARELNGLHFKIFVLSVL